MGFINKYTDNFLPTTHPWEDDTTHYSLPSQPKKKLSEIPYDELKLMLEKMSAQYKSMPMCQAKVSLKNKMMAVIQECKQRDELEEATAQERDDAFEPPLEDTITAQPGEFQGSDINPNFEDTPPVDNFMLEDDDLLDDDLLDDEDLEDDIDDDLEDEIEAEQQVVNSDNTTNFLIGALVVITLIVIMKK